MVLRVGINGFGRVGRIVFRNCLDRTDLQIVAINDPAVEPEYICYLIKFDSTHGKWTGNVTYESDFVKINNETIVKVFNEKLPTCIPWNTVGVQYVIEASGIYSSVDKASGHLYSDGVKRVIITAPCVDAPMIILGVNEHTLTSDHRVMSCGSSTLYCLAPIVKVLNDKFGVEEGFITSIHAMTPSLKPLDGLCLKGNHWRDHRSIHQNIIPATTGACKALGKIMPSVRNKLTGMAFRVPIVDVSVLDLTVRLKKNASLGEIFSAVEHASKSYMKNIIKISREEAVSSDFIGDSHSCILDLESSLELSPNFFKLVCWYENEYSYACRVLDSVSFSERQFRNIIPKTRITHIKPTFLKKQDSVQQTNIVVKTILPEHGSVSPDDSGSEFKKSHLQARKYVEIFNSAIRKSSPTCTERKIDILKNWEDFITDNKINRCYKNARVQCNGIPSHETFIRNDYRTTQEVLEKEKREFTKIMDVTDSLLKRASLSKSQSKNDNVTKKINQTDHKVENNASAASGDKVTRDLAMEPNLSLNSSAEFLKSNYSNVSNDRDNSTYSGISSYKSEQPDEYIFKENEQIVDDNTLNNPSNQLNGENLKESLTKTINSFMTGFTKKFQLSQRVGNHKDIDVCETANRRDMYPSNNFVFKSTGIISGPLQDRTDNVKDIQFDNKQEPDCKQQANFNERRCNVDTLCNAINIHVVHKDLKKRNTVCTTRQNGDVKPDSKQDNNNSEKSKLVKWSEYNKEMQNNDLKNNIEITTNVADGERFVQTETKQQKLQRKTNHKIFPQSTFGNRNFISDISVNSDTISNKSNCTVRTTRNFKYEARFDLNSNTKRNLTHQIWPFLKKPDIMVTKIDKSTNTSRVRHKNHVSNFVAKSVDQKQYKKSIGISSCEHSYTTLDKRNFEHANSYLGTTETNISIAKADKSSSHPSPINFSPISANRKTVNCCDEISKTKHDVAALFNSIATDRVHKNEHLDNKNIDNEDACSKNKTEMYTGTSIITKHNYENKNFKMPSVIGKETRDHLLIESSGPISTLESVVLKTNDHSDTVLKKPKSLIVQLADKNVRGKLATFILKALVTKNIDDKGVNENQLTKVSDCAEFKILKIDKVVRSSLQLNSKESIKVESIASDPVAHGNDDNVIEGTDKSMTKHRNGGQKRDTDNSITKLTKDRHKRFTDSYAVAYINQNVITSSKVTQYYDERDSTLVNDKAIKYDGENVSEFSENLTEDIMKIEKCWDDKVNKNLLPDSASDKISEHSEDNYLHPNIINTIICKTDVCDGDSNNEKAKQNTQKEEIVVIDFVEKESKNTSSNSTSKNGMLEEDADGQGDCLNEFITKIISVEPPMSTSHQEIISLKISKTNDNIYDKLESVSASNSNESFFDVDSRKSQVLQITDLTHSFEDLERLDKICKIIEISDELSDKLLSCLNNNSGVKEQENGKWSFKELCDKINLDNFCNDVFGK